MKSKNYAWMRDAPGRKIGDLAISEPRIDNERAEIITKCIPAKKHLISNMKPGFNPILSVIT